MQLVQHIRRTLTRAFHAAPVVLSKHSKRKLEQMFRSVPSYPYPIKATFKQSWFGLYGGKHIQFGNNVPLSRYKTRRYWLPNVRHKKLWSHALRQLIEVNITANVLRTVDKVGGLDNYLLGNKPARVRELGPMGWSLRWKVLESATAKAALQAEHERLRLLAPIELELPSTETNGFENATVEKAAAKVGAKSI